MTPQPTEINIQPGEVAHRQFSHQLREQILRGEIVPKTELSSTVDLAKLWKTSKSTAHTALNNLVKEGLLERRHGSGTYVCERPRSLTRIGIYYGSQVVLFDEENAFVRSLQILLERKLAKLGIGIAVFVDRRPRHDQSRVLPELRRAVDLREIQGLIISSSEKTSFPALSRLPICISAMTSTIGYPNQVGFDTEQYFKRIFSELEARRCRSVGFISSAEIHPDAPTTSSYSYFLTAFFREAEAHGINTRPEWIRTPRKFISKKIRYGYEEFRELWNQSERPEAVIVYPDMAVRGVVTAVLEVGAHHSKDMTFCFHGNDHVDLLCPFPAIWTITNEGKVADAMIDMLRRQHAGKKISPVLLPFEFNPSRWSVAGHI